MVLPRTLSRRAFFLNSSAVVPTWFVSPTWSFESRVDPPTLHGSEQPDKWLLGLKGKHKQVFHANNIRDTRALSMIHAYFEAYSTAYGVNAQSVNAILATQGVTMMMLFGDETWKKYEFGRVAGFSDPLTLRPAVRNIFRVAGRGELVSDRNSIESLTKRGVVLLACNNELAKYSRELGKRYGIPEKVVYGDLRRGLLTQVVVVPAMPVAIGRAQEHGCTYISTA